MSKATKEDWYVRLTRELYSQLVELAKREDRSISSAARKTVSIGLRQLKASADVRNSLLKPREAANV